MALKTPPAKPSLVQSNVSQTPTAHTEILETIVQLRRERQAQAQLNHHARLSRDEAEQYAAIATHHAQQAERSAQQADRTAKTMPDPAAIILISIGASFLISLAINHLSKSNEPTPTQIRTENPRPRR
jgi:hypothetical protein